MHGYSPVQGKNVRQLEPGKSYMRPSFFPLCGHRLQWAYLFSKCYMWRNFTRIWDSNFAFGKENYVYKCVRWADKYTVGLPRRPILCLITPEMVGGKCIWHFSDVSFCDASLRWSCAVKMKDLDCLTVKKLLSSSKTVVCMLAYILRRFMK